MKRISFDDPDATLIKRGLPGSHKKSSSDKWEELLQYFQQLKAIIPLICHAFIRVMELAPYYIAVAGCQGFIGPLPSAFLDK